MKKNNKGFTLIELLVVVAIIGILAAVGVTAYSGYTTSAKKASAKSNHATVKKYVANELKRCELDGGTQMSTNLTCADISGTANTVADAVETALISFKNLMPLQLLPLKNKERRLVVLLVLQEEPLYQIIVHW